LRGSSIALLFARPTSIALLFARPTSIALLFCAARKSAQLTGAPTDEQTAPVPNHGPRTGGSMGICKQLGILFTIALAGCAAATDGATLDDSEPLGEGQSALCRNALSPAQEKVVLKLIDDICGDTWCEGDNNFAFDSLSCRSGSAHSPVGGSCTLKLDIIPRVDDPPRYRRSCSTHGFTGFDSLVSTAPNGYQSLQPAFYDALSECINRLEADLPH
jgi:hypothetical protein